MYERVSRHDLVRCRRQSANIKVRGTRTMKPWRRQRSVIQAQIALKNPAAMGAPMSKASADADAVFYGK